MKLIVTAALLLCVAVDAWSQSPAPVHIDGAQRFVITAKKNETPYQIDLIRLGSVVAPASEGYRLPVIYLTDGNTLFAMVAQMVGNIVSFSNRLPAVLVVAIGYPADPAMKLADDITRKQALRTRDLSPAGAANFLAFIEDDLKPFIAGRFAVDPGEQTLAGHSLGGFFTVYAFLNRPHAFKRYVAASPSLFVNDHAPLKQLETFAPRPSLTASRMFISVGGLETKQRMGQDMIGDARSFADALQRKDVSGLDVTFHLFEDEDHLSVIPGALMRGLRAVGSLP